MSDARSGVPAQTDPAAARPIPVARSMPLAGLLAWLVPGLGHYYLGLRRHAIIFVVTTSVTFWTGVAVGGVKSTVNPSLNGAWFAAQLCMGVETLGAWAAGVRVQRQHPNDIRFTAFWPSDNIAVVYTGITGLLNLLIIIDALARAEAMSTAALRATAASRGRT